MLQNRPFFALAPGSGFGGAISGAVARSSISLCRPHCNGRIKVPGAAACKILLSFAAESGVAAWLHQACDSDLSANFLNFGVCDFPFKILFRKCFKIVLFSALAPRSGFGAAIFCCQCVLESFFVESLLCAKACCVKNIAV